MTDYTQYITSQNQKPNFLAIINGLTQPFNDILDIDVDLNVDTATGSLLDTIGAWVGASRILNEPLNILAQYDNPVRGYDSTYIYYTEGDPISGLITLGDIQYRQLVKAQILKNQYRGTTANAYEILQFLGLTSAVQIIDNLNMTMTVNLHTSLIDTIILQLILQNYFDFAPVGVTVTYNLI